MTTWFCLPWTCSPNRPKQGNTTGVRNSHVVVRLQGLGNYRLEPNPHTVHLKLKTRQSQSSGFNSRYCIVAYCVLLFWMSMTVFQIRAGPRVKTRERWLPVSTHLSCWVRKFGKIHVSWPIRNLSWTPDSWKLPGTVHEMLDYYRLLFILRPNILKREQSIATLKQCYLCVYSRHGFIKPITIVFKRSIREEQE